LTIIVARRPSNFHFLPLANLVHQKPACTGSPITKQFGLGGLLPWYRTFGYAVIPIDERLISRLLLVHWFADEMRVVLQQKSSRKLILVVVQIILGRKLYLCGVGSSRQPVCWLPNLSATRSWNIQVGRQVPSSGAPVSRGDCGRYSTKLPTLYLFAVPAAHSQFEGPTRHALPKLPHRLSPTPHN